MLCVCMSPALQAAGMPPPHHPHTTRHPKARAVRLAARLVMPNSSHAAMTPETDDGLILADPHALLATACERRMQCWDLRATPGRLTALAMPIHTQRSHNMHVREPDPTGTHRPL